MTCILSARRKHEKVILSDSALSSGTQRVNKGDLFSKLVRFNTGIVGFAGPVITKSIVEGISVSKPNFALNDSLDVFKFGTEVISKIKDAYDSDFLFNRTLDEPFELIVLTSKSIFTVDGNLAVIESKDFAAIGSGSPYVLGYMEACYEDEDKLSEIVLRALDVAVKHDGGCAKPFTMEKIK